MRACLGIPGKPCAKPVSSGSRCPTCKREFQRQRKAQGRTGERGSTHASRERRQRVLNAAKDELGVSRCFYCFWAEATIADHYNPLALNGTDTEDNLRAACQPCNSRKGDSPPEEFLASGWLAERRKMGVWRSNCEVPGRMAMVAFGALTVGRVRVSTL